MSTAGAPVVVVGASLAGATTALMLRELGYDGHLVLVGDEVELPYERPALSKEFLLGTMDFEQMLVRPRETYDELGIELCLGRTATGLDTGQRLVVLDGGERVLYDTLVIATGAMNVRPPIPGLHLPGVHQLRTRSDASRLRAAAVAGSRAAIVGMGFIGCEIAASLRQLDVDVTAADALAGPLLPQLGPVLSQRVRSWHERHGVRMLFGSSVSTIEEVGSALEVATTAGDLLPADLVVVGVGVRPNVDWLTGTSLHSELGILVDEEGRTELPSVYAVGDVATQRDERTGRLRRAEHWSNAIEAGRRVAHTVLGLPPPPKAAPYFWSAQHGHYLQYVGEHSRTAELITREDAGRFTGFYLEAGVVTAAVTIDNGRDLQRSRRLLGRAADTRELADPGVDLRFVDARDPA